MRLALLGFLFILSVSNLSFAQQDSLDNCVKAATFKIVVIGSSTAAGSGASNIDSSWVGRYRNYMESLNPANEVINLARGGYHTYKLMPSNYVPPSTRPEPDTARNITQAISLEPDAIIINLPSNDVSLGYGVIEQLVNFDTIVSHALRANIPIWVCTTQPKNYSNPDLVQQQIDLRDSIFARYRDYAIDFWSGMATPEGMIDPLYDFDGTHVNDLGHALLFRKVIDKKLPWTLLANVPATDFSPIAILPTDRITCNDKPIEFQVVVQNFGSQPSGITELHWATFLEGYERGTNLRSGVLAYNSKKACTADTFLIGHQGGDLHNTIEFWTISSTDSDHTNDTLRYSFQVKPNPEIYTEAYKNACGPSDFVFNAQASNFDSVYWYADENSLAPIATGTTFQTGNVSENETYWVEAVKNLFIYEKSLATDTAINRDWNGVALDVIAKQDLTLNSVDIPIASTGQRAINIYIRNGSHVGKTDDQGSWTFYKLDTLSISVSGDWTKVDLDDISMASGDTLAFYFTMDLSSSNLHYNASGLNEHFENDELEMLNGTGVAFGFGQLYFPRTFIGQFNYTLSYYDPEGCKSERIPVKATVENLQLTIPQDLFVCPGEELAILIDQLNVDQIYWYDEPTLSIPIDSGSQVLLGPFIEKDSFYVQGLKNQKVYSGSLETQKLWNRDWNGIVTDVVAKKDMVLDTVWVPISSFGAQIFEIYTTQGSGRPVAQDPTAWTALNTYSINVTRPGEWLPFDLGGIELQAGDTLGFYFTMQDSSSVLKYHASGREDVFENYELQILNGTGVSFKHGQLFIPRTFIGGFDYHYRNGEEHDCLVGPETLVVDVFSISVELAQDTFDIVEASLKIAAPSGFTSYNWSNGEIGDTLVLNRDDLDAGYNQFSLVVIDDQGCTDIVYFWVYNMPVSVNQVILNEDVLVYPNPGRDYLSFYFKNVNNSLKGELYHATGQKIWSGVISNGEKINTNNFPNGLYLVKVQLGNEWIVKKWIKS
jgi:lysophospholipase L1-like esterase